MASQPVSHPQPDTSSFSNNNNQAIIAANPRWPTMVDGKRKTKKRVRNFTPADRAAHRVFEKSRREAFNDQLMELARLIPAISSAPRLSKHTIVNESIAYHRTQDRHCLAGIRGIQALITERDELLEEVNSLRALLQPGATAGRVARPLADDVVEFMSLEAEINKMNKDGMATLRSSRQDSSSTTSPDQGPDGDSARNNAMEIQHQQLCDQQEHLDMLAGGPDLLGDVPQDFDFWEDIDPTQAIPSGLQTSAFDIDTGINNEHPLPIPIPQRPVENNMFHDAPRPFAFPNNLNQDRLMDHMDPLELSTFPATSGGLESTQSTNSSTAEITPMMPLY
ncbi:hypothetical protein PISL3812_01547 [Talaromyces islandicus]|uniref:BHLH domain-containing protein n=1 Tax=Talaromyces islandicus TaxID=28573 RepID=A0A0U1LMF2_TALIS|nr:hypothetical protein PISL3812_01547 [Talaromyces islandicus]